MTKNVRKASEDNVKAWKGANKLVIAFKRSSGQVTRIEMGD